LLIGAQADTGFEGHLVAKGKQDKENTVFAEP
jgi:hypothetical protein